MYFVGWCEIFVELMLMHFPKTGADLFVVGLRNGFGEISGCLSGQFSFALLFFDNMLAKKSSDPSFDGSICEI